MSHSVVYSMRRFSRGNNALFAASFKRETELGIRQIAVYYVWKNWDWTRRNDNQYWPLHNTLPKINPNRKHSQAWQDHKFLCHCMLYHQFHRELIGKKIRFEVSSLHFEEYHVFSPPGCDINTSWTAGPWSTNFPPMT